MRERDRWSLKPWWSQDPISKTIIFRGFCNKCDSSIFRKIDQPLILDDESLALLAYRAACYWNWRSEVDLRTIELTPSNIRKIIQDDQSMPPLADNFEVEQEARATKTKEQRDRVSGMMKSIQSRVLSGDYSFLESYILDFACNLPCRFSIASTFAISLHFENTEISQYECPPMPALFMHLLNSGGSTKLILSWLKDVPDRYPTDWLAKLIHYSETGHLADVLLRYMFIQNHGLVMRPSFASSLGFEQSSFLTASLASQFYLGQKPQPTRICNPPYFDLNWKVFPA
jgi:hypothetical protein